MDICEFIPLAKIDYIPEINKEENLHLILQKKFEKEREEYINKIKDLENYIYGKDLKETSLEDLLIQQKAINREISSRSSLKYKTQLGNFYRKYRLTEPVNYIYISSPRQGEQWIVGISCPLNIKCDQLTRFLNFIRIFENVLNGF